MRTVCKCGQAVNLPDTPGRYGCPKCRQQLPPVATILPAPVPVWEALASTPAPAPKRRKKDGSLYSLLIVLLVIVVSVFLAVEWMDSKTVSRENRKRNEEYEEKRLKRLDEIRERLER